MQKNIIHVHIFEPHKPSLFGKRSKNERSELHIYTCEKSSECDAYKNGTCINAHNVFGAKCPIGRKSVRGGFTQRANKYHAQISEWKDHYSDVLWKLKEAPKRVTKVSGGWMLPYSFINMNEKVLFHDKGGFLQNGSPYLEDEAFTKEAFESILTFRPYALMGGEIKEYQSKQVPKFVKDLHDYYPEKFNEVASDSATQILESYDFKGRKAFLKTIKPDCHVIISKKKWHWDGVKITKNNENFMIFEPCEWESCRAEFVPNDSATVVITDNDQVTHETKFAD